MPIATNVTRLLDARGIPYRVYELPPEKLGAVETARLLGVEPALVYKTIVAVRERGRPLLAVIPGDHRLDLKRLAAAVGEKKLHLPTEREAERLTGLQAGGISPLALLARGFQVVISRQAEALEWIHLSGGQRGLNLRLPPAELKGLVRAAFADISQPEGGED